MAKAFYTGTRWESHNFIIVHKFWKTFGWKLDY